MMRQYLTVRFREGDRRTYTYHNDGGPVREGDKVRIPDRHNPDEWRAATVVALGFQVPEFPTKPIAGRVDSVPSTQGALDLSAPGAA